MNTEVFSHNGKEYMSIDLVQFVQKSKPFYIAKIKASDFLKIYTVRPAQYDIQKNTSLARSFPDEKNYYHYLINEDRENLKSKDFQRDPNETRVSQITNFW